MDVAILRVSYDVIKTHKAFLEKITCAFFAKIDKYRDATFAGIEKHKETIASAGPQDEDGMLQYALHVGTSYVVSAFLSRVRNLPLSQQKSVLLEQLKYDLLELKTDAGDPDDMNGYVRAMYVFLQTACEKNSALAAENYAGKGTVNSILQEQIKLLEDYYPDEVLLAKEFYKANLVDFKQSSI